MESLKSLFRLSANQSVPNMQSTVGQQSVSQNKSSNSRRRGETYVAYGKRLCGFSNGESISLAPFLQMIFTAEKQKQLDDVAFQEEEKKKKQDQISSLTTDIAAKEASISRINEKIKDYNDGIADLHSQISELKGSEGSVNRDSKVKLMRLCQNRRSLFL